LPTGLSTQEHIYFENASDYYRVHPDEQIRTSTKIEFE